MEKLELSDEGLELECSSSAMIFVNNAATSFAKPESVYDTINHALRYQIQSNRGTQGKESMQTARQTIATFLNVDPACLVFTPGCTYSLNMAIQGFPFSDGDHVVTMSNVHHGLSRPLKKVADEQGLIYHVAEDMKQLMRIINDHPVRFVGITHASNVTGEIAQVDVIAAAAHEKGACVLLDCAQTGGVLDLPLDKVDLAAFAGHKGMYGPPGVGLLYVAPSVKLNVMMTGGTGNDSGAYFQTLTGVKPHSLEVGTMPVFLCLGLAEGVKWVTKTTPQVILRRELELINIVYQQLRKDVDKGFVEIVSPTAPDAFTWIDDSPPTHVPVMLFNVPGMSSTEVHDILSNVYNIVVRPGFHCSSSAHNTLGTLRSGGAVRLSTGFHNTEQEMLTVVKAIRKIAADAHARTSP